MTRPVHLIPTGKHDVATARAAVEAGYPSVEQILPDLLQWVQDGNWPVARILGPFLSRIGLPLVPEIRRVLDGDDGEWKWFILQNIVKPSPDLVRELRPDLERIVRHPTAIDQHSELDELAAEILCQLAPGAA